MKITIEPRSDDFRAHINGDPSRWAAGKTPYEAIGSLVSNHASHFGITIEFAGNIVGTQGGGHPSGGDCGVAGEWQPKS